MLSIRADVIFLVKRHLSKLVNTTHLLDSADEKLIDFCLTLEFLLSCHTVGVRHAQFGIAKG